MKKKRPPLSIPRRDFLRQSLILPSAYLGNIVFSQSAETEPSASKNRWSFVHFTDIHVQPELRAAQGFRQAVLAMNQLKPKPVLAIAGGDLVMDAFEQEYPRADQLFELYGGIVKDIDFPVYSVLGNHDLFGVAAESQVSSTHLEYGKKMFANRLGGGKTYRSFDFRDWHFVLLDSIQVTASLSYEGGIDDAQFDWLKKDLISVGRERPVVLVSHIPFFSILPTLQSGPTEPVPASIVIRNTKEILEFCSGFNIKLVLQGHVHIVEEHGYKNEQIITSGAVCGNWWKGPRMGFPEGFAVYTIDEDRIRWSYKTYGWKTETS